jgi:hypothetical protein
MNPRTPSLLLAAGLLLGGPPTLAAPDPEALKPLIEALRFQVAAPEVLQALRAQNQITESLSLEEVAEWDASWSTVKQTELLSNAASQRLQHVIAASDGLIGEIVITDARGLNVAQTAATPDRWQADEEPWRRAFRSGVGGSFVGTLRFDREMQALRRTVAVAISDPETGALLGAAEIALLPEEVDVAIQRVAERSKRESPEPASRRATPAGGASSNRRRAP